MIPGHRDRQRQAAEQQARVAIEAMTDHTIMQQAKDLLLTIAQEVEQ